MASRRAWATIGEGTIKVVDGKPLLIRDVARIDDGGAPQTQAVSVNGKDAVYLNVLRIPGGNTIEIVDAVKERVANLRNLPPGMEAKVYFDQSGFVRTTYRGLKREIVQALLLVALVILVFLQSFRGTLIVSAAIPLSFAITLIVMYASGQTLNAITLGGLTLAIGPPGRQRRRRPRVDPPLSAPGLERVRGRAPGHERGGPAGAGLHAHHHRGPPPGAPLGRAGQEALRPAGAHRHGRDGGLLLREPGGHPGGVPLPAGARLAGTIRAGIGAGDRGPGRRLRLVSAAGAGGARHGDRRLTRAGGGERVGSWATCRPPSSPRSTSRWR